MDNTAHKPDDGWQGMIDVIKSNKGIRPHQSQCRNACTQVGMSIFGIQPFPIFRKSLVKKEMIQLKIDLNDFFHTSTLSMYEDVTTGLSTKR